MTRLFCLLAIIMMVATGAARAQDSPPRPIGQFDPEQSCGGPVSNPVCAYKTWFFCRVADRDDMCRLVLGKGEAKDWDDRPWVLPLSRLMAGPLAIYGYAFIGTRKVDAERLGNMPQRIKGRLVGSTEVMDTYADPSTPGVAYIGSEFYAEKKPGQWTLVGWSLNAEGGPVATECDDAKSKRDSEICKLRIDGITSWADMMRGQKGK